jgi:hypothetical protein
MMVTGRPWDELEDTLTAPRLEALFAEWRQHPPVGDLVAAYIGYKPPLEEVAAPLNADDPSGIGSLIMQFPSGHIPANR